MSCKCWSSFLCLVIFTVTTSFRWGLLFPWQSFGPEFWKAPVLANDQILYEFLAWNFPDHVVISDHEESECGFAFPRGFRFLCIAFAAEPRQRQITFLLSCSFPLPIGRFSPLSSLPCLSPTIPVLRANFFSSFLFYIHSFSHYVDINIQPLGDQDRSLPTEFTQVLPLWLLIPLFFPPNL